MKPPTCKPNTGRDSIDRLPELTRHLQNVEGFPPVVAALQAGRSVTIDGAWGSSNPLVVAALETYAPRTILIVLAHPRDLDGWFADLNSFTGMQPTLFPAWENQPGESTRIDEITTQRLRCLRLLDSTQPPRLLVTTLQALLQPVPEKERLAQQRRQLSVGSTIDPEELLGWLVEYGYRRTEVVELPGEFSRRGGILDVFSPDAESPCRLEFFGDEIESIRPFAPQTQRSFGPQPTIELIGTQVQVSRSASNGQLLPERGHICDYLPADAWAILSEPEELIEQGKHFLERVDSPAGLFSVEGVVRQLLRFPSVRLTALPSSSAEVTCHLRTESVERFTGNLSKLREELAGIAGSDRIVIACHNEAERGRLATLLGSAGDSESRRPDDETPAVASNLSGRQRHDPASFASLAGGAATLLIGQVREGFRLVDAGIVVIGDQELFHRDEVRPIQPRRRIEAKAIDSFLDLNDGDLVVHVSHGIARFRGMRMLEKNGQTEEHLTLEFRDAIRVYVPASKIDLVQKYIGSTRTEPELSKYGGTAWQNKKARVEAATLDLAAEMIELQAHRAAQPGIAYPPDSDWQRQFEAAFPYAETPDQLTALGEIRGDMERSRPMDRLICGDVGYGKTELAIRAAFKVIDNSRQVAVLVPTTLLAEQHFRTFRQRLAEYPFVIESLNRFRTSGEQRRIVERLGQGGIDIIIGTHRLLSADVQFKELGLVVIDEEQRFGVDHKERLKRLRQTVDVLTMTATPIPRTLHLALLGIRDISNLETPPPDRLAIETRIARFDPTVIRQAMLRELNREGQVYFVHNRVQNIHEVAQKVQAIVPEARLTVAHGQMPEGELEEAMLRFIRRESDILVATTIIESGLDIPNANTIFINQADLYGLADLHQLRGRVGRYKHRAYCYLLLDSERGVTPTAARRLKAIEEFTELGAGFKIALRDLEIRGAGNILGTQQSGHIAAVGYELYCQLLENAVRQLRNQQPKTPLEISVELPWPAFLPRAYVAAQPQRIEVYRRLARVRKLERLEDFRLELRDRFGPLPEPVEWMLRLAELRLLAARWQITQVRLEGQGLDDLLAKGAPNADALAARPVDVVLIYRQRRRLERLANRSGGRLRIVDDHSAYYRLRAAEIPAPALYQALKDLLRLPDGSL